MRKIFIPASVFSLLAVVLVLTFSACKKDAAGGNVNITGEWAKAQFQGLEKYAFKSDGTVEYNIMATDSVTKRVIGYRYKSVGKYSVNNAELTMYDLKTFSNINNNFGPVAELVPVDGQKTITYTISVNSQKNKLSLFFTCPANADCVPSPMIYYKQ
ncbi:MAG TPA: hypothetical protein VK668_17645 [Mucilaginibacter sp.]|nr:hypothetical protein [Mucilaginibacter sp.]